MNVCTIIAKNYLAHARVLARSLLEANPESRLWTLVIDDFSGYIDPAEEPFTILTPKEVGCEDFDYMALRYSVLELSTAVKPWLLRHLMGETGQPITYLDPDIKVYGSLQTLDDLAAGHGVVLTPHNTEPIPQDGRNPSQVDVMIAGIYNLGYVSLAPGPEVERLLDWWSERLRRDSRVDPRWGYFVDQRWFDLAPGFMPDLAIVRDPQYNVAYWNLHQRRLERENDRYLVQGRPLAFFHFSGFDPDRPLTLSRHQNRIDVLDHPVLEQLLGEYAAELMGEGHAVSRHWPYEHGAIADGTKLDERLIDLFDEFAEERQGAVASPFTTGGLREFDRWLREQAPNAPAGISRALARVYEGRADVRGAFPNLGGDDQSALLNWAEGPGQAEEPALARLMLTGGVRAQGSPADPASELDRIPSTGSGNAAAPLRGAPWGVNVVGDFLAATGDEQVVRGLVEAMDVRGVRALPISDPTPDRVQNGHYATASAADAPFTVNLVCVGPQRLPEFVRRVGAEFFSGRYSVGLWMWPAEKFPEAWRGRFSLLEEIWVPSSHVARALAPLAEVPVTVMRMPVVPLPPGRRTRAELGLTDEGFLFYSRVDCREGIERQNPLAVISAFRRAFDPGDGAHLVLDCAHALEAPEAHASLIEAAGEHPDIEVVPIDRSPADAASVCALCDCYVSLHRAEAFGFAIAEAMWFDKPAIATGYSGNLDFMNAANSRLVDHRLVRIGPGHWPYPEDGVWALPDEEHAAAVMRQVFDDPDEAQSLGADAGRSIRATHSAEVAGEFMRRRLESIRVSGAARAGFDPVRAQPAPLARLPLRIRQGPGQAVGGRGRAAREQLRQAILRVIKPYSAYQQSVNADIVAALGELNEGLDAALDEARAQRADLLAAARGGHANSLETGAGAVDELKRFLTLQTDRAVYLALDEMRARHSRIGPAPGSSPESLELTSFELRAFSQNGEDGVLAEILRRTGAASRFFVEFGVESGREGNCVYLADAAGWHGLFMEAGDEMYRELRSKYVAQDGVQTIQARVGPGNLEALFRQAQVPAEPDLVSIDVDGQDYWIWEAIKSYRPRVLVIEYNSALDPRRRLVQPAEPEYSWSGTEYYGASLGALEALGNSKGYRLVHTELSGVNAFFVRRDLLGDSFPALADVPRRGAPNYFQRGYRHPPALMGVRYLDLDTGRLVADVQVPDADADAAADPTTSPD